MESHIDNGVSFHTFMQNSEDMKIVVEDSIEKAKMFICNIFTDYISLSNISCL